MAAPAVAFEDSVPSAVNPSSGTQNTRHFHNSWSNHLQLDPHTPPSSPEWRTSSCNTYWDKNRRKDRGTDTGADMDKDLGLGLDFLQYNYNPNSLEEGNHDSRKKLKVLLAVAVA